KAVCLQRQCEWNDFSQRGQMGALCYLIGKGTYAQHAPTFHTSELHVKSLKGECFSVGADVNIQTCDGITALHEASKNGHKQIVAELLTKNADANKTTNSGLLPLHILPTFAVMFFINTAIFVLRVVSLLVSVTSRARLRHSWVSPLHLAAEHNRHTVAAVLLKTGADVNATLAHNHAIQYADHRATALYFAIANGSTEAAEVLLNAGASVSLDPVSPLLMAVRQGCISTVPLLLERGADVDARIPSFPTTFPGVIALCLFIFCFYLVLPRSLQHLCRLSIRTQMGRRRLNSLTSLPLPDRLCLILYICT
uniref:Ankyrin repeat and SOCS box containing 2b n=1 Tax=Echeneis naucrates TaxID=173247 RepID=A0A665WPT5_ECHNA